MRVTNSIQERNLLRNLRLAAEALEVAQQRTTTGKKLLRPSDDPAAAARIMELKSERSSLDQYRRNVEVAQARVAVEERVLDQLTQLLDRAKEIGLAQGSDSADASSRQAAKAEVEVLIEAALALGNTSFAGERLFGGFQTRTPPFPGGGGYVGDEGVRTVAVAAGVNVQTGETGRDLLVTSGVLSALEQLRDGLATGTSSAVRAALPQFDQARDAVQELVARTGARTVQLDVAGNNIDAAVSALVAQTSGLEDAELEDAVTRLAAAQTALQAALVSANRVLGTSLVEYLR
jgi:flagellar hook-associated protein 3 FlgL